jgi:hypothetical protein
MAQRISKTIKLVLVLSLLVTIGVPSFHTQAQDVECPDGVYMTPDQKKLLDSGVGYYDICELTPPAPPAGGGGGPGGPLVGCNNIERTWNFLKARGMSDIQAAGSMGNLQHEGNFNPRIVEGGGLTASGSWSYSVPRMFPREMDTIPPPTGPAGQPGYGIVQWTSPGRKQGLQAFATADQSGRLVNDLGLQLDYMWSELSGAYREAALDPLLRATDLAEAVSIWQDHYEVGSNFQPRFNAAQNFLNRASSGDWCS